MLEMYPNQLLNSQSNIDNQRFIIVAENISYKRVFQIIAKNLKVKIPNKLASKKLLIAYRF